MANYVEDISNRSGMGKIGLALLIALFSVSFYSKSGVNFFAALAYILTIIVIVVRDRNFLSRVPLLLLTLIPLVFGLVASVFSYSGGWVGAVDFLGDFKFFFLPLSISVLLREEKHLDWLFMASLVSAVIMMIYGYSHDEQRVFGKFHGYFMYPNGRTSDMLLIIVVACVVFLDDDIFRQKHKRITIIIVLLFPLFLSGLYMGSIRASWLGFALAILSYSVLFKRKWLIPIILISVTVSLISQGSNMGKEVSSIFDFENNISNNTRLHLWITGWDFSAQNIWFGTGEEGVKQLFLDFFNSQPLDYQESYKLAAISAGNFHNSYLQIYIEWGVLTISVFVVCASVLVYKLARALSTTSPDRSVFIRAFLIVSIAFLFSQVFHGELNSYGATIYLLLMYGAINAASNQKIYN